MLYVPGGPKGRVEARMTAGRREFTKREKLPEMSEEEKKRQ